MEGPNNLSDTITNKNDGNSQHDNGTSNQYNVAEIMRGIYGDGFIGLKGAFSIDWVQQLHEDILKLYEEALKRPGGAVGRGPNRHYVEIHPEDISGFVELATHPWIMAV